MPYQSEPTVIEFFQYNHWENQELMRICIKLSDEIITANLPGSYGSIRDTFAHILMSVVNHGIAHRADITTILNQKGISLPELDVWGYQSASPERLQARVAKTGQ